MWQQDKFVRLFKEDFELDVEDLLAVIQLGAFSASPLIYEQIFASLNNWSLDNSFFFHICRFMSGLYFSIDFHNLQQLSPHQQKQVIILSLSVASRLIEEIYPMAIGAPAHFEVLIDEDLLIRLEQNTQVWESCLEQPRIQLFTDYLQSRIKQAPRVEQLKHNDVISIRYSCGDYRLIGAIAFSGIILLIRVLSYFSEEYWLVLV